MSPKGLPLFFTLLALVLFAGCQRNTQAQPPVTVRILPYADMRFTLNKPVTDTAVAGAKQAELYRLLLATPAYATSSLHINVQENAVIFHANATDALTAGKQLAAAVMAMEKVFGKKSFTAPNAGTVFRPADAMLQMEVGNILLQRWAKAGIKAEALAKGTDSLTLQPRRSISNSDRTLLVAPGRLELRLIPRKIIVRVDGQGKVTAENGNRSISEQEVLQRSFLVLDSRAFMPNAGLVYDRQNRLAVSFQVRAAYRSAFGTMTAGHIGEQLLIVLDDTIIMAPTIAARVSDGRGMITGNGDFTEDDAIRLAAFINTGPLPAEVQEVPAP